MDRLIHTSLSALRGAMARQAATANNLANANTAGFRAEMAATRPVWVQGGGMQSRATASEEVLAADMRAGTVSETGRDLDIAIQGDDLLAVQGPEGDEAYTRRGDLQRSRNRPAHHRRRLSRHRRARRADHPAARRLGQDRRQRRDLDRARGRRSQRAAAGRQDQARVGRSARASSNRSTACSGSKAAARCRPTFRRRSRRAGSKARTSIPPRRWST